MAKNDHAMAAKAAVGSWPSLGHSHLWKINSSSSQPSLHFGMADPQNGEPKPKTYTFSTM